MVENQKYVRVHQTYERSDHKSDRTCSFALFFLNSGIPVCLSFIEVVTESRFKGRNERKTYHFTRKMTVSAMFPDRLAGNLENLIVGYRDD